MPATYCKPSPRANSLCACDGLAGLNRLVLRCSATGATTSACCITGDRSGRSLAGVVMFSEFDRLAMTRALALAERGLETTHPNPRVGCVIAKGDRIIGEGWHERAGEAHAEVAAIRSAKEPVAGATAYVTLEPCSHHGRTPPCVNALIEARIARVVFAVQDPNPRVSGQGADALLCAGITVEAGLMQAEATELNIGFMKRMREGLPWVRVKLAMSLDGRTALANGASQWITSESARADVQRWRARCSAVMTGVGTVLADDPQLNVRVATFKGRQPLRVVLDARLRSPVGAKMFVGLGGVGAGGPGAAGAGAAGTGAAGIGAAGAGAARASAAGGAAAPRGATGAGAAVAAAARAGTVSGAAASLGGDVLIFTAVGGEVSASGSARTAALVDSSTLNGDLAELVNAFETSPTSVAARYADLAGPISTKTEAPARAAGIAPGAPAKGAGGPVAVGIAPPILAAATSTAGVAPTADDATWAGVALSGAVAVRTEAKTLSDAIGTARNGSPTGGGGSGDGGAATQAPSAPSSGSTASATSTAAAAASAPAPVSIAQTAAPGTPGVTATGIANATGTHVASGVPANGGKPLASVTGAAVPAAPVTGSTPQEPTSAAPRATAATDVAANRGAASAKAVAGPDTPAARPDTPASFQARRAALSARGVRIEEVPADEGFLDLFAVLKRLGDLEVNEVLVEAGPTLAGQLLTTFFADELLLYIAPKLLGPQGRPLVNLPELQSLQDAWGFSLFDAKRFGDDLRLRMRPK
jgi:riboflavin biosynthesis pyrimidine reductase/pyrimidine deaminase RibD-like protein